MSLLQIKHLYLSMETIFLLYQKLDVSLLVFGYIIFEAINAVMLGRKQFSKYARFILLQKFLTLFLGFGFYFILNSEWIIFALVLTYIPYIPLLVKEIRKYKIEVSLLIPKKNYIIYKSEISSHFSIIKHWDWFVSQNLFYKYKGGHVGSSHGP